MFESNSTKCWTSLNWRNIEPWSNDPKSEYNIFKTFMKNFFFYEIKFKIHKEQIKIGSVVTMATNNVLVISCPRPACKNQRAATCINIPNSHCTTIGNRNPYGDIILCGKHLSVV